MNRRLFICHTAYQVLINLCRALRCNHRPDLLLSTTIPDTDALAERLGATGLFAAVTTFDEGACGNQKPRAPLTALFFGHWLGRRHVERYGGLFIGKNQYSAIYIHNDWSVLGRYLQDKNLPYILCEDTFGSTHSQDFACITRQRSEPFFALRRALRYGYLYWGDYKGVTAIESECPKKVGFASNKLVAHSKKQLLESLTRDEKGVVAGVFITSPLPQNPENAVLFLPRDFAAERLLTADEQTRIFTAVVNQYCAEGTLFIKAHPRDTTDYSRLFKNAVVLERTMPSEVLNFALSFRFSRAVTVESTVLKALTVADEKIHLSLEQAKQLI